MNAYLQEFRKKCLVGLVGGSDVVKIAEQIGGMLGKSLLEFELFRFLIVS